MCLFKVQGKEKRLEVVIVNQNFEPKGAFRTLLNDGLSGVDWGEIFSVRGLSAIAFIILCVLLMVGNSLCKDVVAADNLPPSQPPEIPEGVHPYEDV